MHLGNNIRIALLPLLVPVLFQLPVALATEAVPSTAEEHMIQADQKGPGKVVTSVFTTSIVDGKPVDNVKEFANTVTTVFYFTRLKGLDGQTITHRWKYLDRVMAVANIEVSSDTHTAWSSNTLEPNWTGFWVVEVLNSDGEVISVDSFTYNYPRDLQIEPDPLK
jgi:hypothetical protein